MGSEMCIRDRRGIVLGGGEPTIRLVTHLDIGVGAVDQLATEINNFFA